MFAITEMDICSGFGEKIKNVSQGDGLNVLKKHFLTQRVRFCKIIKLLSLKEKIAFGTFFFFSFHNSFLYHE